MNCEQEILKRACIGVMGCNLVKELKDLFSEVEVISALEALYKRGMVRGGFVSIDGANGDFNYFVIDQYNSSRR